MGKKKSFWQKIPAWLKNKYAISTFVFLVWMIFFDQHDLISQVQLKMKWWDMENKKEYYSMKIEEVNHIKNELFTNDASLEKFAREKYMMKKSNEDLFIITDSVKSE